MLYLNNGDTMLNIARMSVCNKHEVEFQLHLSIEYQLK